MEATADGTIAPATGSSSHHSTRSTPAFPINNIATLVLSSNGVVFGQGRLSQWLVLLERDYRLAVIHVLEEVVTTHRVLACPRFGGGKMSLIKACYPLFEGVNTCFRAGKDRIRQRISLPAQSGILSIVEFADSAVATAVRVKEESSSEDGEGTG